MKQAKSMSMIEAVLNTAIGWLVAVIAQVVVFPWFGVHATVRQNMGIAAALAVVSIIRSYIIRRLFNGSTKSEDRPDGNV